MKASPPCVCPPPYDPVRTRSCGTCVKPTQLGTFLCTLQSRTIGSTCFGDVLCLTLSVLTLSVRAFLYGGARRGLGATAGPKALVYSYTLLLHLSLSQSGYFNKGRNMSPSTTKFPLELQNIEQASPTTLTTDITA